MEAPKEPLSRVYPLIFVHIFSRFCVFSNLPGPLCPGPRKKSYGCYPLSPALTMLIDNIESVCIEEKVQLIQYRNLGFSLDKIEEGVSELVK